MRFLGSSRKPLTNNLQLSRLDGLTLVLNVLVVGGLAGVERDRTAMHSTNPSACRWRRMNPEDTLRVEDGCTLAEQRAKAAWDRCSGTFDIQSRETTVARFIVPLLMLALCSEAWAAGSVSAQVVQVRVDQDGRGMVMFAQPLGGSPPACRHSAYFNALAFDTNTPGGRSVLAMALAAKATGDSISVVGSGACGIYGGSWVEDWVYGIVQ